MQKETDFAWWSFVVTHRPTDDSLSHEFTRGEVETSRTTLTFLTDTVLY